MEIINSDLLMRTINLHYDFAYDTIVIYFDIDTNTYELILSEIIYFSFSNPNNMVFPLVSDSVFKILDSTECRKILENSSFGYSDYNIPDKCYYLHSECSVVIEIIANKAEGNTVVGGESKAESAKGDRH